VKRSIGAVLLSLLAPLSTSAPAAAESDEHVWSYAGELAGATGILWARCNRAVPAHLGVELWQANGAPSEGPPPTTRELQGPRVDDSTDFTGSMRLGGFQPDTHYRYRVTCRLEPAERDPGEAEASSAPDEAVPSPEEPDRGPEGGFRTPPLDDDPSQVSFVWLADIAGQGWGRNPDFTLTDTSGGPIQGGFAIFDVIRGLAPHFAILAGDIVYADNPVPATQTIPPEVGGGTWRNDPTRDFVAITLADYRASWRYNLGDPKLRAFLLETPALALWDDHEVADNWYPGEILVRPPYNGVSANLLAKRARQALYEYTPIRGAEIYRRFRYGSHLELFLLDVRSFRGPNSENFAPAGIEMLGAKQFQWLTQGLKTSNATWKVVVSPDPLSLVTGGSEDRDSWAQGDPRILGREVQLRRLLGHIAREKVDNVVFLSADVHFAAAIGYDPANAPNPVAIAPFWEFVSGPVHAGAFGAADLDASFGPHFDWLRAPSTEGLPQNLPPPNLQSFGAVDVNAAGVLTVRLHDASGAVLYEKKLEPSSAPPESE
jgi:alkaline phosphatase D